MNQHSTDNIQLAKEANERMRKKSFRRHYVAYAMLLPFTIFFLLFTIVPVIWNFVLSLTYYNITSPMRFAGLANYRNLFTDDDLFLKAINNTMKFGLFINFGGFLSSLLLAWMLSQVKFKNAFAFLTYVPSIIGGGVVAIIMDRLFADDQFGIINSIVISFNIGGRTEPLLFSQKPDLIIIRTYVTGIWSGIGAGFLINLAAFVNVPTDLYEAAAIDGVHTRFQEFVYVTLPSIKPQMLYNAIMATVGMIGWGGVVGSPEDVLHTLQSHLTDHTWTRYELGYGAAIGLLMFVFSTIIGTTLRKLLASKN